MDKERLRRTQRDGITRRIFFDPFSSFDTTTPSPRSPAHVEALASVAQMVSKTVLSLDDARNAPTTQAGGRDFLQGWLRAPSNCQGAEF